MTIIGRKKEQTELADALSSQEAEFIAVYGRRRVGKTYLIKTYFNKSKAVLFESTGIYKGKLSEQLHRFGIELGQTFYGGASIETPKSWMDAFNALEKALSQQPKNKKIIIFLDELPWMATPKSRLLQALEYFWNRHWSFNKRLKLIICGSSASWIIKKIIKNKGGLHNRITRKMRLMPLNLHDTKLFLDSSGFKLNYHQITKLYMMMGGIPFYLKRLKKNLSIDQNINNLFFSIDGIFFDEFSEVFNSLFDNSAAYEELVELIANRHFGIARSELEKRNTLTGGGGRLTQRLDDLESAGFILSYKAPLHKARGTYYRIADEYCHFYLKWIKPIKNQLKLEPAVNHWLHHIDTPRYASWQGYCFENICFKHLSIIKKALNINEAALASPWQYQPSNDSETGAQIDVFFTRNDDAITLGEIKFTNKPYVIDKNAARTLRNKMNVFQKQTKTKKQLFLAMITNYGIKEGAYADELISGIVQIEDFFEQ